MLGNSTKKITRAGLTACLYVVLSLITFPLASGAIQFRLSEALTLLPLFYIETVPALFVGCILINLITGCAILDVVLGSLITLLAGAMTYLTGRLIKGTAWKILIGGIFPVLLNALLLPLIWLIYGTGQYVYILQCLFLFISQTVIIYGVGTPFVLVIKRQRKKQVDFLL